MSAVTVQEIVSLIEGLIESDACMGSISDKQVVMALEVVSRIKQHGIAPPDGMVLVPKEPVLWVSAEDLANPCFVGINAVREGHELRRKRYDTPLYAGAPEVKP